VLLICLFRGGGILLIWLTEHSQKSQSIFRAIYIRGSATALLVCPRHTEHRRITATRGRVTALVVDFRVVDWLVSLIAVSSISRLAWPRPFTISLASWVRAPLRTLAHLRGVPIAAVCVGTRA